MRMNHSKKGTIYKCEKLSDRWMSKNIYKEYQFTSTSLIEVKALPKCWIPLFLCYLALRGRELARASFGLPLTFATAHSALFSYCYRCCWCWDFVLIWKCVKIKFVCSYVCMNGSNKTSMKGLSNWQEFVFPKNFCQNSELFFAKSKTKPVSTCKVFWRG